VLARSAEGMAVAVDSLAWEPDGDGSGRWLSSPAARLTRTVTGQSADAAADQAEDLTHERPAVLTLSAADPSGSTVSAMWDQPRTGPKGKARCVARERSDQPVRPVVVGELHRERRWGGEFVYSNTRSTSWQVGWSESGVTDWKLAGSASFAKAADDDAVSGGPQRGLERAKHETFYAEMEFARFKWRCGEPDWEDVYTVEPVDWTGGLDPREGGTPASCNRAMTAPVGGGRYFRRGHGASETHQAAFGILGFTGSTTTAAAEVVSFQWNNEETHTRYLCGDRDFPRHGNTRVVSLP